MKSYLVCLFIGFMCFISCKDTTAKISVSNEVPNVRLENISFCKYYISGQLLPGSMGTKKIVEPYNENIFPLSGPLEFTMVRGSERVFLKTNETFKLDGNEELDIVIDENTEVFNPSSSRAASPLKSQLR